MTILAIIGVGIVILTLSIIYEKINKVATAQYKIARDADKNFKTINEHYIELENRLRDLEDKVEE